MRAVGIALCCMTDVDMHVCKLGSIPREEQYDVLVTWNGLHAGRDRLVPMLRRKGVPVIVVERGFWDRMWWSQIDHRGFNHTASWAQGHETLTGQPERLVESASQAAEPMRARSSGYVLLLVQKAFDTQLIDAPFQAPKPFVKTVEAALPPGVTLRIRAHPVEPYDCGSARRARMIEGSLRDAIDGARFVVTINSNAGNDAILWGCPVLCVGPSIYGQYGVAMHCPPDNLATGLETMLAGWSPGIRKAADYCAWLAGHQYSLAELADGLPVKWALRAAVEARHEDILHTH